MAATSSTSFPPYGTLNLDHIDCRPETKNMLAEINKFIAEFNKEAENSCLLIHQKICGKNFFFFGENHVACQDLASRLFEGAKKRVWRIFDEGVPTHPIPHSEFLKNRGITEGYCFGMEPNLNKLFYGLVNCTFCLHSQEKHGLAPLSSNHDLIYLLNTTTQEFSNNLAYPECSEVLNKLKAYPDFVKLLSTPFESLKEYPVACYQFLALEILNILPVTPDVFKRFHYALSTLEPTSMGSLTNEINLIREMAMGYYLLGTLCTLETSSMSPEYAQIDTFVVTGSLHTLKLVSFLEAIFSQSSFPRLSSAPSSPSSSSSPPPASSSSSSSSSSSPPPSCFF